MVGLQVADGMLTLLGSIMGYESDQFIGKIQAPKANSKTYKIEVIEILFKISCHLEHVRNNKSLSNTYFMYRWKKMPFFRRLSDPQGLLREWVSLGVCLLSAAPC